MAELPEAEQSNRQRCSATSSTSAMAATGAKMSQPRIELGRNAAKNIEIAALAIRSTSQTSLFPELTANRCYSDWRRSSSSSSSGGPQSRHEKQFQGETSRSNSDVAHLLNTTRLALMAVEDSVGKTKKAQRKSVTFNNTPLVHEIEFFDASATPESGSHIVDDVDEVFSAGSLHDDDDNVDESTASSSTSSSVSQSETGDEDEDTGDSEDKTCSNIPCDGQSDDSRKEEGKEMDKEEEQRGPENPQAGTIESSEPESVVRSTESPAKTVRHTQQIDLLCYLEPQRRAKNKDMQRKNRISRDVVLNQLEKRKSASYTCHDGNLLPLSTYSSKHLSASRSSSSVSIDAQIMQAILRAKSSALYAADTSSTHSHDHDQQVQNQQQQEEEPHIALSNGYSDDDNDNESSDDDCKLHSENTSVLDDAMQDQYSKDDGYQLQEEEADEPAAVESVVTMQPPQPPRLSLKASLSEFSTALMTELERISFKDGNVIINNSSNDNKERRHLYNVQAREDMLAYTRARSEKAIGLEEKSEEQSISSSAWQNISHADFPRPKSLSVQQGRLYVRIMSANNLDFPIDPNNKSLIRCVASDGSAEYYSEFRPLYHTVHFNHEFCIDVQANTEFTITLQLQQPGSILQSNHLQKFFAVRKRHRKNSILRYINDFNGAIAQTRVAFHDIEKECRSKLCTASFALVNSWYRYARQGLISKRDKELRIPEKAVGKLIAQLFFFPSLKNTKATVFPSNLDACEQALNIRRYYSTCWQSGYMSQLGGDVRFWRRRFFTLRGWRLFSSSDASSRPRVVIDLSLAVVLATHNQIILQQDNDLRLSLEECLAPTSVKNGFRIVFNTGEVIDYFCDTAKEKGRWLDVLRVVIEKIPEWPQWMERDDDDDMFTDDNSLQLATT